MRHALVLARRGLGQVWPNPAVGCLIVRDGRVVGRGWTQLGGRPHAEAEALARASVAARNATAYVTLEPCCHSGKTPPCTEALISAGLSRIVIAIRDPDPRVAGKGVAVLRNAGIEVFEGVLSGAAGDLNAGFLKKVTVGRPLITLKTSVSVDGRIATAAGSSQWVTGDRARFDAHMLRAQYDAILVASSTAVADNPMLTCRLPGMERQSPVRILLDAHRRVPNELALFRSAKKVPLWIFTVIDENNPSNVEAARHGAKIKVVRQDQSGQGVDLAQTMEQISNAGITRLLVEAGGQLGGALLRSLLVDQIVVYRAPSLIGGDGVSLVDSLGVRDVADALFLERIGTKLIDRDIVETYKVCS